jgi:hypothetical protein
LIGLCHFLLIHIGLHNLGLGLRLPYEAKMLLLSLKNSQKIKCEVGADQLKGNRLDLDANRFLSQEISGMIANVRYITVGKTN